MTRLLRSLAIVLLSSSFALADIPPLSPPPPRPDGPQRATIRGLSVEQVYVRSRRSWMTRVSGCAATQPGCRGGDVARWGCYVRAVGGTRLAGGDIAALRGAIARLAGPAQVELTGCRVTTLTLDP